MPTAEAADRARPRQREEAVEAGFDEAVENAVAEAVAAPADTRPDAFHEALAVRLSARLADRARYVAAWHRWLLFDGTAWRPDETLRMVDEARTTCRAAAHAAGDARDKFKIGSAAMVAAVERLARADARHAASADQWDADPWLLNTPAGTVDLRSGALRPHRCSDYITRTTAVAPSGDGPSDGNADCPLFHAFLKRIFAGDAALIGFVQRALGYALTGETREHALFFAYGTGGNGKSVLLDTVARILGGYAAAAPMDSFTAAPHARHPTELAMLRGARLVVGHETRPDRAWDEARIKALSGGDPIVARMMRADAFTYRPRFKLFIAGNHKPSLNCVDEAIRRRFTLIPFTVTIPAAAADRALARKLEAEWPGILAWLIAGCREWQRIGLAPPAAVTAATADYLAEEDTFGAWLAEWVHAAPGNASETTADLFASWETYAAWAKEPAGSRKAFGRAMRTRGFAPCRIGDDGARGFKAIQLRRHSEASVMLAAMSGRKIPIEGL